MIWPFALLETFVNGGPPAIGDDYLNEVQNKIVALHRFATSALVVRSDFLGGALDDSQFNPVTGGGGSIAFGNDEAAGGSGVLELITSAAGGTAEIDTFPINIGTSDFRYYARHRRFSGNIAVSLGLRGAVAAERVYFFVSQVGGFTWNTVVDATPVDTGIVSSAAGYDDLLFLKYGTTLTFWINGVLVDTRTFSTSIGAGIVTARNVVGAAVATEAMVDAITFWADRG